MAGKIYGYLFGRGRTAGKSGKYGNEKIELSGQTFDSKREGRRYLELQMMLKGGLISDLRLQVPFELIPAQKDQQTGKTIERAVNYVADFVYKTPDGKTVVEDSKGYRTEVFRIKKKLMLWRHGIEVKEV